MQLRPKNDGVTHINIYSRGNTTLGRWLSNFTKEPIETEDGSFDSIEGYWYWLGTKNDKLRFMSGFQAKRFGRSLRPTGRLPRKEFKRKIKKALRLKINSNKQMKKLFLKHLLPFTHYYFDGHNVTYPVKHLWLVDYLNKYRMKLVLKEHDKQKYIKLVK